MIAFGPIPSRRLGFSLGINNIPPKHCSYACPYCQVGPTNKLSHLRRSFYGPYEILLDVKKRIALVEQHQGKIDYISFVPDGEPTSDINLGREILLLKPLGYKIAVFTNASLLNRSDVRADLMQADWVSVKIDSTIDAVWRKINRPHGKLDLREILEGIRTFGREFGGILATETMLVQGVNDFQVNIEKVVDFLHELQPSISYIAIPTRPPTDPKIHMPEEDSVLRAFQMFRELFNDVQCLIGENPLEYGFTGNAEDDLLRTAAVQPMTEEAVDELLAKDHARWDTVHKLIAAGSLREMRYNNRLFYLRKFPQR